MSLRHCDITARYNLDNFYARETVNLTLPIHNKYWKTTIQHFTSIHRSVTRNFISSNSILTVLVFRCTNNLTRVYFSNIKRLKYNFLNQT